MDRCVQVSATERSARKALRLRPDELGAAQAGAFPGFTHGIGDGQLDTRRDVQRCRSACGQPDGRFGRDLRALRVGPTDCPSGGGRRDRGRVYQRYPERRGPGVPGARHRASAGKVKPMMRTILVPFIVVLGVFAPAVVPVPADDLLAIRAELERALPQEDLERFFAAPPLVFRGAPQRGSAVYRDRVNGVVLLASTDSVGTGVLVSSDGDIITNDHIVHAAFKARGAEWVAVWFKPAPGVQADKGEFYLARVVQRNALHDLAHLRLAQELPATAAVVPLASFLPAVGQEVFTIGHPKTYPW